MPARVVAGRYRLGDCLGTGGFGEVFRADDLLTGEAVAVKLLPPLPDAELFRLRVEVAAMRMLRLPGVALLLDEGREGASSFIAMELLEGKPFPGRQGVRTWDSVRDTVIALLETLARVHSAGVVHGDLKPDNVLVDASGRPTVLDFGLSAGRVFGTGDDELTASGSPAYASPEQLRSEPTNVSSDLYSLGVMIYEVLTGRLPQVTDNIMEALQMRLSEPATPIRDLAPGTPDAVAEVVDQLLARDPRHRPRNATQVLRSLQGEAQSTESEHELPRLGGDGPVQAVLEAARAGRPLDLWGEPGSGRTRCLREAWSRLVEEGRRALLLRPAAPPFGSLEPFEPWREGDEPENLDTAFRSSEKAVVAALAEGVVVLVDDWEDLDRWSARVLERCRDQGTVVVARVRPRAPGRSEGAPPAGVHLERLTEHELRALFAGPDRVLFLQEDGARELWRRTDGLPARMGDEVAAWIRAGLATWDGAHLAVDRPNLDRLRTGLRVLPAGLHARDRDAQLAEGAEELLAWIDLASSFATRSLLVQLTGRSEWQVEAELADLEGDGIIRCSPDDRYEALVPARRLAGWTAEERRTAHSLIAGTLPAGSPERLFHLVAAGDLAQVPDAACELASHHAHEGRLGEAEAAISVGIQAVRLHRHGADSEARLFREWMQVALAVFTPRSIDRVLYELTRATRRTPEIVHVEALLQAAMAVLETDAVRALDKLDAVAPFEEPELERWRQAMRVLAARDCEEGTEEAVLREVSVWAAETDSAQVRASQAEWHGRFLYRQDRHAEAANVLAGAAELAEWTSSKLSAMLNGASSLLEDERFDEVVEVATSARELASSCRHALFIERAEWLIRSAAYRRGDALEPDLELVEAAALVGLRDQEALIVLTEAAFAWRGGDASLGTDLAGRVARIWTAGGKIWGALLAQALELACAAEGGALAETGADPDELAARAVDCPAPEHAGQILALLHRAGASQRAEWRAVAAGIREKFASSSPDKRREVLTIREMLAALESE